MTRTNEHPLAPSLQKLNRATLIAFAVAAVLLVVAVLPAEYGRDPTGIGRLLGLTPMGEMKVADAAAEAAASTGSAPVATSTIAEVAGEPTSDAAPAIAQPTATASAVPTPTPTASASPKAEATKAAAPAAPATRRGEVSLTLAPNEGREVKASMKAGDSFRYEWSTGGPEVRFELHGERLNAADGDFSSYEKGSSAGARGSFTAPFEGTHGWYWRNRTDQPVTITVRATGVFQTFAAK